MSHCTRAATDCFAKARQRAAPIGSTSARCTTMPLGSLQAGKLGRELPDPCRSAAPEAQNRAQIQWFATEFPGKRSRELVFSSSEFSRRAGKTNALPEPRAPRLDVLRNRVFRRPRPPPIGTRGAANCGALQDGRRISTLLPPARPRLHFYLTAEDVHGAIQHKRDPATD